MNKTTILEIVREGFEEQKGVKILSLFFDGDNIIRGIYILPPKQTLSFLQAPLLDMTTDLDKYTIILEELGQVLMHSYRLGSIFHFDLLSHESEINCENGCFDVLVDTCLNNPPLLLFKQNIIDWIQFNHFKLTMTDETQGTKTQTFLDICQKYNKIDSLIYDKELDISNSANINNQLQYVKQQLEQKKYKKVTELQMNEIDKIFIRMQIDLYMTDY